MPQHLCPINNAGRFLGVSAEMVGRCLGGWNETNALVLRMASLSLAVLRKAQLLLGLLSWGTFLVVPQEPHREHAVVCRDHICGNSWKHFQGSCGESSVYFLRGVTMKPSSASCAA